MTRMRFLAQVNPSTAEFDALDDSCDVTFMPLETVWADDRLDSSRIRAKKDVAQGYVRFRDGDILCPKVTPTFQAGRSALVSDLVNGVGAATTEVHVLRALPGLADPRFIRYHLLTKQFLDEGVSRFQGVAGLQRVPDDFLRDFPVCDLPLPEQSRIADYLDDQVSRSDAAIDARRQQLHLLREMKRSATAQVLAEIDSPRLPLGWQLARNPSYGVLKPEHYDGADGVPLLRIFNVGEAGAYDLKDLMRISPTQDEEYRRTRIAAGDVLVSVVGTLGRVVVADDVLAGSNLSRAIARVIPRRLEDGPLVAEWLRSLYFGQFVQVTTQGTAQAVLNMGDLVHFPIAIPTDPAEVGEICRRIAEKDDDFAAANEALVRSIELLREQRSAVISAALSGEFEVTTASGLAVSA